MDGWQSMTEGVRSLEKLPLNARKYIQLIEDYLGVPGNIFINFIIYCSTILRILVQIKYYVY